MKHSALPKAFVFDLDGVLTDTARFHYLAWKELADHLQLKFSKLDNERLKGISREDSFEIILKLNKVQEEFSAEQRKRCCEKKNQLYNQYLENITQSDLLPGVKPFLVQAKREKIKLAVASASHNACTVLDQLKITDVFDYIADAHQIAHPKPDPEVFLDCSQHFGISPELCIGFEDAQAGIEAIKRAGMFAVGIHVKPGKYLPDLQFNSTNELDFCEIINAFARKQ